MSPFGYTMLGFGGGKNQTYTAVSEDIPTGSVVAFTSVYANEPRNDWISADKFIVTYSYSGAPAYQGEARVGTVSGTSISFGTMAYYTTSRAYQQALCADPFNDDKFVVAFENNSDIGHGWAVVGTVSGTTPSFGTQVQFTADTGFTHDPNLDFDPNTENKLVIVYKAYGNSSYGTAVVGTISGTSISFGT